MEHGRVRAAYVVLLIAVAATVTMVVMAVRFHAGQRSTVEAEVRNQLLTIADMRVRQLATWRSERLGIARVIVAGQLTASALQPLLEGRGSRQDRDKASAWLTARCQQQQFVNAVLTDRDGNVVIRAGQPLGNDRHLREAGLETIRANQVIERDFHRDDGAAKPHLGYNIPLRTADHTAPIGTLLLGVDPEQYIYPLLKTWPIPSPSGETLLVRRDGNDVLYLNHLRHRSNTALTLRLPLTAVGTAAVKAVLGAEGFVTGTDYRGINVLAAVRKVPETPWYVVAKVDAEEVFAPVRERTIPVVISVMAVFVAMAASAAYFWRREQSRLFKERYEAEVEKRGLEEQLAQAQKMESIGRLAGGVAHDFNNQLTVINGYSAMLLKSLPPEDPRHEQAREILTAGEEAATLTRQLLAFSRKQVREPKILDLNRIIVATQRMLHRVMGDDVIITTKLDPGDPTVVADAGQLNQILMNLAVNARDAMPHGGAITITTTTVNVSANDTINGLGTGSYVMMTFRDSGIGMDPSVQTRIFEPFFTTKGHGAGTGLGLSTVYGIMQQAGGTVQVESALGAGAVFRLYFPAALNPEPRAEPVLEPVADVAPNATVLIVEDQTAVRKLAVSVIREIGYEVLEASSGEEALEIAAAHPGPIQLLVTDIRMPGMSGRELTDRLALKRPDTKVLYVSGHTEDAIVHQNILDARVEYLAKPFTPEQLRARVRDILAVSHSAGRFVLVIDDEDAVRTYFQELLTREGYRVLVAPNGKVGMQVLEREKADLVITDLVMPEQEGLETVGLIRKTYPEIPVIVISGAFGGDLLATAKHLGAHASFKKPVDPAELLGQVRAMLRQ